MLCGGCVGLACIQPCAPSGAVFMPPWALSSSSSQAGLGGGVSGWSKPLPCAGMWKKIRARAPDTQQRHGWERNQKADWLHPVRGWNRVRAGYPGTRGGCQPCPCPLWVHPHSQPPPWAEAGPCRVQFKCPGLFFMQPAGMMVGRHIFATEELYLSQARVTSLWSALREVQRCLLAAPRSWWHFCPVSWVLPWLAGIP